MNIGIAYVKRKKSPWRCLKLSRLRLRKNVSAIVRTANRKRATQRLSLRDSIVAPMITIGKRNRCFFRKLHFQRVSTQKRQSFFGTFSINKAAEKKLKSWNHSVTDQQTPNCSMLGGMCSRTRKFSPKIKFRAELSAGRNFWDYLTCTVPYKNSDSLRSSSKYRTQKYLLISICFWLMTCFHWKPITEENVQRKKGN